jgi:hypothetical protein
MYREENLKEARDAFARHGVDYMFIGKGAAIIQGFPDTTQDIDIYPRNDPTNNQRLVQALRDLGFDLEPDTEAEIERGTDFIQIRRGPFDLDIVFAPDGFESHDEAMRFKLDIDGYPVMSIEGIIRTKRAAGRPKDRASLPQLVSFKEHLDERKR